MSAVDPVGPAPEAHSVRFLWLLFGVSAAPIFWLGQLMLSYGVTAYTCYPGDHPIGPSQTSPVFAVLAAFDAVALTACAAGAIISWRIWQRSRDRHSERQFTIHLGEGRVRFLALWGLMSSLWFFVAVLFNTIASVAVPPCLG